MHPSGARDVAPELLGRGAADERVAEPRPDRAFEAELGSSDGATLFQSIYAAA